MRQPSRRKGVARARSGSDSVWLILAVAAVIVIGIGIGLRFFARSDLWADEVLVGQHLRATALADSATD